MRRENHPHFREFMYRFVVPGKPGVLEISKFVSLDEINDWFYDVYPIEENGDN